MPTDPTGPAPEVSAEGRRLIDDFEMAVQARFKGAGGEGRSAADRDLTAYVAGLEAEVARWRAVLDIKGHSFGMDTPVRKTKGSSWHGRVVGFYSTALNPIGYAVESRREPGSVQIYPESALEADPNAAQRGRTMEGGENE